MKVKLIVPPGLPIPELSRCPPSCLNSGAKDYQKSSPELNLESGGRDLPKVLKGLTSIKVGGWIVKELSWPRSFHPFPIYPSASVPATQFIVAAGTYRIQHLPDILEWVYPHSKDRYVHCKLLSQGCSTPTIVCIYSSWPFKVDDPQNYCLWWFEYAWHREWHYLEV